MVLVFLIAGIALVYTGYYILRSVKNFITGGLQLMISSQGQITYTLVIGLGIYLGISCLSNGLVIILASLKSIL